jgi:hypothetical protein
MRHDHLDRISGWSAITNCVVGLQTGEGAIAVALARLDVRAETHENAIGVGGRLAACLGAALRPRIVTPFVYTAATSSEQAYDLLGALNGALNGGRLSVYAESADPEANAARRELLHEAAAAGYEREANQQMIFNVPEFEGHDDRLNILALLTQAVEVGAARSAVGRSAHAPFSGLDRPRGHAIHR